MEVHLQRIHQKIKNFVCKFCDHRTFSKWEMKMHSISQHSKIVGVVPFYKIEKLEQSTGVDPSCEEKRLKIIRGATKMTQNRRKGKFQCTMCLKTFAYRHSLNRHINNIHVKAELSEGNCSIRF